MESGHHKEHTTYRRTPMANVYFVNLKMGGANHIWRDCLALNRKSDLGFLHLHDRRTKANNKPECFWNAGVITTYWITLPLTEHMLAEDTCHICKITAKK
eukprot:1516123-Heterocapsa_arctica.AAC.1